MEETRTCGFDGCHRPMVAHGLCSTHYSQERAGKQLKPIHVRPTCTYLGCEKMNHARGYCHAHYRQILRGEELRPIGAPDVLAVGPDGDAKTCAACGKPKPFTEFHRNGKNASGYARKCRPCSRVESMVSTYGLPVDMTVRLMAYDRCDACNRHLTEANRRFDHDHSCCPGKKSCGECFRGVICHGCNLALGHAGDSVERLERLIDYLKR